MSQKSFDLALMFTGHMIDLPGRTEPRFPQHAEPAAWVAIRTAIERARGRTKGRIVGIASGARGGDLLFHEGCRLFGIERRMVLPFPPGTFIETSVAGIPNGGWETKFADNWDSLSSGEREVVANEKTDRGYALCNQRMIALAKELSNAYEVIALWDGKPGDGPGGTAEHVDGVRRIGGVVDVIDTTLLMASGKPN